MSKIKKILLSLTPLISFSSSIVSCSNNIEKENKFSTNYTIEKEWKLFLENEAISNILRELFPDEKDREIYIKSQQDIKTDEYLKEIKEWKNYYNIINYNHDGGFGVKNTPFSYTKGKESSRKLSEKNWLWFLFNINRFIFTKYDDKDKQNANQSFKDSIVGSNQDLGFFKILKSNKIVSFVKDITYEDENSQNILYTLLTDEGFILEFHISKRNNKITSADLLHWIASFPKLLEYNQEQLEKHFNLIKFTRLKHYRSNSKIAFSLFKESYGGDIIAFALIDTI